MRSVACPRRSGGRGGRGGGAAVRRRRGRGPERARTRANADSGVCDGAPRATASASRRAARAPTASPQTAVASSRAEPNASTRESGAHRGAGGRAGARSGPRAGGGRGAASPRPRPVACGRRASRAARGRPSSTSCAAASSWSRVTGGSAQPPRATIGWPRRAPDGGAVFATRPSARPRARSVPARGPRSLCRGSRAGRRRRPADGGRATPRRRRAAGARRARRPRASGAGAPRRRRCRWRRRTGTRPGSARSSTDRPARTAGWGSMIAMRVTDRQDPSRGSGIPKRDLGGSGSIGRRRGLPAAYRAVLAQRQFIARPVRGAWVQRMVGP